MKTFETFLNELTASEELLNEFTSTKTKEEAIAFLKAHDCDATAEEVAKAIQATEGEISDEDATAVAGGCFVDPRPVEKKFAEMIKRRVEEERKWEEEMKKNTVNTVDMQPIVERIKWLLENVS